jgi:hypothetical protein
MKHVLTMTQIVGRLEGKLRAVEVVVREVVGTEVVEVLRDATISE